MPALTNNIRNIIFSFCQYGVVPNTELLRQTDFFSIQLVNQTLEGELKPGNQMDDANLWPLRCFPLVFLYVISVSLYVSHWTAVCCSNIAAMCYTGNEGNSEIASDATN